MARIEITDLKEDTTISEDEIKHVKGGAAFIKIPSAYRDTSQLFNKTGVNLDSNVLDTQGFKF